MTGIFDFIGRQITRAENDEEFKEKVKKLLREFRDESIILKDFRGKVEAYEKEQADGSAQEAK